MITVAVPCTSANLGPGFDGFGVALDLENRVEFSSANRLNITVSGPGAHRVSREANNLVYRSFTHFHQNQRLPVPSVKLHIEIAVPLSRGLGSSATAIVAGLVGANEMAGKPLTDHKLLELATELEGHPDNVAPALLGGCQLALVTRKGVLSIPLAWHPSIHCVLVVPAFELSTRKARAVLPKKIPRADGIFNSLHTALLVKALESGNPLWLQEALQDRLHQPYRMSLIPGFESLQQTALELGAYGMVLSGAGPTVLALCPEEVAMEVGSSLVYTWGQQDITAESHLLSYRTKGYRVF
jgi:homoserine kinase